MTRPLQELDDRHLPGLARWTRRRVERWRQLSARASGVVTAWEPQALDTRYAGRLPFSLVLRNPALALVVTGAVLAAALASAVVEEGNDNAGRSGNAVSELMPQDAVPEGALLGPRVGERVHDYLGRATDGLVGAVRVAPGERRVALVSLAEYRTPDQARIQLAGFTVRRVFLHAKAAGKQATIVPVDIHGALLPALRKAYAETATSRAQANRAYLGYVQTLRPKSSQDRAFRALYAAFARSSGIEAHEYAQGCACVFAALVVASPAQLLTLNARAGVRAVQVAAAGVTVLQVQAQPLLPEVTGVVPRPAVAGFG